MMRQSQCTFVADSSDHHFHSNNYPQQSHRAVDLHRWDPVRTVECYGLQENYSRFCFHQLWSSAILQLNLLLCGWSGCWSKPGVFTGPPDQVFCSLCCCSKLEIPVVISSGPSKELHPATLWYNLCESPQSTLSDEHWPTGLYLDISFCPWQVEDSLSSLSLQINIPVLSLTLTLLLLLGIVALLLGLKRMSKHLFYDVFIKSMAISGHGSMLQCIFLFFLQVEHTEASRAAGEFNMVTAPSLVVTECIFGKLQQCNPLINAIQRRRRRPVPKEMSRLWHINVNVMRVKQLLMLFICLKFSQVCPLKNPLTSSMRSGWGGQSKRTSTRWIKACKKKSQAKNKIKNGYHLKHTQFNKPMTPQTKTMCCYVNIEHNIYANKNQLPSNTPGW